MSSPSSCDYWGDEDLSPAVLDELAVFEANQVASTSRLVGRRSPFETMPPLSTNPESDDSFDPFNVDMQNLQGLDAATEDYRRKEAAAPAAPASKPPSSNTFGRSLQTTLHSTDRKVKKWDHTAFAKTETKRKTGKRKARELDEDADEEDAVEQFTAPLE
jgi:hypothetical protein